MKISTHAPRTGSDKGIVPHSNRFVKNFNPRSPHGERPCLLYPKINQHYISTHAPRTGSDPINRDKYEEVLRFQPTLPARGATGMFAAGDDFKLISTHAPRTGSDNMAVRAYPEKIFQPTLPARGATVAVCLILCRSIFQPTLPARGATTLRGMRPAAAS